MAILLIHLDKILTADNGKILTALLTILAISLIKNVFCDFLELKPVMFKEVDNDFYEYVVMPFRLNG